MVVELALMVEVDDVDVTGWVSSAGDTVTCSTQRNHSCQVYKWTGQLYYITLHKNF